MNDLNTSIKQPFFKHLILDRSLPDMSSSNNRFSQSGLLEKTHLLLIQSLTIRVNPDQFLPVALVKTLRLSNT